MLVEAMIAILIFSVGLLGIIGLQAKAVAQVSDARDRSEAALLANQLIATMRTQVSNALPQAQNLAALQASFNSAIGCSADSSTVTSYCSWLSTVNARLPMGSNHPVLPAAVLVDNSGIATVTIYWLPPSEDSAAGTPVPHVYTTVAQITTQQLSP